MKRLTIIATLAFIMTAAQAQTVAFDQFQLTPLPSTARVVDDSVEMVWLITSGVEGGVRWEKRTAVTGCAAGKGTLYYGGKEAGQWSADGTQPTDEIGRVTCNSIKGQS